MPKGEIVGIKLFAISDNTHQTQFKPSTEDTVQTERRKLSVNRVKKVNEGLSVNRVKKVNEGLSVKRVQKVIEEVSFYRVTLYLPSHQWLSSSRKHCMTSMNRAPTYTECMTMPSNVVDAEYQKVIKSA